MRCRLLVPLLLLAAACSEPPAPCACDAAPAALTEVADFGPDPGGLRMFVHAPACLPAGAPLVLVLHGCTQSAAVMEASGWSAAADAHGFAVVYAQQTLANNRSGCFRWFDAAHTARGAGEAASLRQMVAHAQALHGLDAARTYVAGLSAGGFMAASLLAAYPDVFAAGAVNAGGPHGCADSALEASTCAAGGVTRTPEAWGALVRAAHPGHPGPWPRVALWHGAQDTTVHPTNQDEALEQWTHVHGADAVADVQEALPGATRAVYRDAAGAPVVETVRVAALGHALAVDPQTALGGTGAPCGSASAFFADVDVCSTLLQARFFGLAP